MSKNEQNTIDFWNRVKKILKEQKKTQIDLSNNCDILLQTLRNKISRNFAPTTDEVIAIANYLNVSCDYLLTGQEGEKNATHEQIKSALQDVMDML